MSEKKQVLVKDFGLFYEVLRSAIKIVDSAKFIVTDTGLAIYGARGKIARCELTSDAIYSTEKIEFSVLDLSLLVKIAGTVKDIHKDNYSDFKFIVDLPFIRFESKKFKTKLTTINEDAISKWVSKKVETKLEPVLEFKTNGDMIKSINSHSYIFSDPNSLRVYLETKADMENNTIYATLGNNENSLNNEITLKAGLITYGSIEAGRHIIVDLERWNLFNALPSKDITISLMNMNVLVSKASISGKNGSCFNLTIYSSILKS
jgi:hypothetical protein